MPVCMLSSAAAAQALSVAVAFCNADGGTCAVKCKAHPQNGVHAQVEAEGDVATAFTLARMLSDIPLSRGGPTSLVIFDIHALQVGAGFQHMHNPVSTQHTLWEAIL